MKRALRGPDRSVVTDSCDDSVFKRFDIRVLQRAKDRANNGFDAKNLIHVEKDGVLYAFTKSEFRKAQKGSETEERVPDSRKKGFHSSKKRERRNCKRQLSKKVRSYNAATTAGHYKGRDGYDWQQA
jgi:hypothetical protein